MRAKSRRDGVALPAMAVVVACGARSGFDDRITVELDGGAVAVEESSSPPPGPSSSATDQPSGSAPLSGSSMEPGSARGSTAPGSSGPPIGRRPPTGTPGDAGCPPASWLPPPSLSGCWTCLATMCSAELAACAADCTCSQALATALVCETGGAAPAQCFGPVAMGGGPATIPLASCLLSATAGCPCSSGHTSGPSPLDAAGCVGGGSGGGAGGGSCMSQVEETCAGTNYQVVCSCPQGTCVCFGSSTKIVAFMGCPYCPMSSVGPGSLNLQDLFGLCGFPN